MPLFIVRNDITEMHTDAIVNTANPLPMVGSGVDNAIYTKAGWKAYALWVGGGEKMISKDKDDYPVLSMYNDRSTGMVDKIIALQTDAACTTFHNTFKAGVIEAFCCVLLCYSGNLFNAFFNLF